MESRPEDGPEDPDPTVARPDAEAPRARLGPREPRARLGLGEPRARLGPGEPRARLGPGEPRARLGPGEPRARLGPGEPPEPGESLARLGRWLTAVAAAEPTPPGAEGRRLAAAVRLVVDRLVATSAPGAVLAGAADDLERLAARLGQFPHGGVYHPGVEWADVPPATLMEFAPLLGRANPLAPPMAVEVVGNEVIGRARFGRAYEGPPGCVHGGFIAAGFDDVLGMVQSVSGQPGMTGRLAVRYLAPTPLGIDLRFVGRLVGVEGRKIFTAGELFAGQVRTAEAEALFITVGIELFTTMVADRGRATPEVNLPAT